MIRTPISALVRTLVAAATAFAPGTHAVAGDPLPIFDAHLHYNDEATGSYPIADILRLFRENGVTAVLATSRPNDGTRALVDAARAGPRAAPRVVPFVRPYRNHADRQTWFNDPEVFALIESELRQDAGYRGIGEFHVFGSDADTRWVRRIVALAVERGLWLHAHCDDAALEILLAHDPAAMIVWAHSGFTTPPAKIARYLARYPNVVGELSFRYDVTEDGKLTPAWRELLTAFPDRFVLGSDTWVNERWSRYGEIMAYYRGWLGQLPPAVASRIASGNGERLFAAPPPR